MNPHKSQLKKQSSLTYSSCKKKGHLIAVTQQQDFIKRLLHTPAIGTEPLRQEPALRYSFSIQFLEKTQHNSKVPSQKACGPLQGTEWTQGALSWTACSDHALTCLLSRSWEQQVSPAEKAVTWDSHCSHHIQYATHTSTRASSKYSWLRSRSRLSKLPAENGDPKSRTRVPTTTSAILPKPSECLQAGRELITEPSQAAHRSWPCRATWLRRDLTTELKKKDSMRKATSFALCASAASSICCPPSGLAHRAISQSCKVDTTQ